MQVQSLGQEDPLEEEMVTHSSMLAWKIPWTETLGGLYSPWDCKASEMTDRFLLGLPQVVKNPCANGGDANDMGVIPGSGRSPRIGNGNSFQ